MTRRLLSLPMYPSVPKAVAGFAAGLLSHLEAEGIGDAEFAPEVAGRLVDHWTAPDMLLSQTCGYPLTHALAGRVRLVGTPTYDAPGCDGAHYCSVFVVRADDPAVQLADLAGRRAAYNEVTSQSGYNCLRAAVAPLASGGRFFSAAIATGAHRASMRAVLDGRADVAAIDCIAYALAGDETPDGTAGLRILARSASVPGLPLITAAATSDSDMVRLRTAIHAACRDPTLASYRAAMRLSGFDVLPLDAYGAITAMEETARDFGTAELA